MNFFKDIKAFLSGKKEHTFSSKKKKPAECMSVAVRAARLSGDVEPDTVESLYHPLPWLVAWRRDDHRSGPL